MFRAVLISFLRESWRNSHSSGLFLVTSLSVFTPTYIGPLSEMNRLHSAAERLGPQAVPLSGLLIGGPAI